MSEVQRIQDQLLERVHAAAAKRADADVDYRQALAEALDEKISLREVARAAGTTHSNVHRIIHGRRA